MLSSATAIRCQEEKLPRQGNGVIYRSARVLRDPERTACITRDPVGIVHLYVQLSDPRWDS